MNQEYDTYAYYWVRGFECDHSEISTKLDLSPSSIKIKGELSKYRKNQRIEQNSWQFKSSLPRTEIFQDAHLANLLEFLLPRKDQILSLKKEFETGINCVGYYTNVHPGFHINSKLLKNLAQLELNIDFDLYNY